jgi:hypothetical protein
MSQCENRYNFSSLLYFISWLQVHIYNGKYWHVFFFTLVFWNFPRSTTNKRGIKNDVPTKQSLEHVKPNKPSTRQNKTPFLSLFPFGFMPPRNTMHFTKVDVKAKAKAIAKKFTINSFYELPPPSSE